MFATDHPFGSMAKARAFLDQLPVSAADKARIARDNAAQLNPTPITHRRRPRRDDWSTPSRPPRTWAMHQAARSRPTRSGAVPASPGSPSTSSSLHPHDTALQGGAASNGRKPRQTAQSRARNSGLLADDYVSSSQFRAVQQVHPFVDDPTWR
ncbi:hypothetical protein FKR81_00190 [Lentzea tibetensis]|uniref:Amidohydrolase-related domain-containing protein n=1 Tax=Lentzea tibetensis TaxID=2591470 RepID=A0A563F281_9PSEU|nr:hypothetical protein FKR81_00190 [Lentzea tibetensis]